MAQDIDDKLQEAREQRQADDRIDESTAERLERRMTKLEDAISRFHIGGYGEAVMSRNFYSDHFNRFKQPANYSDGSHGRFDLPHVVLNMGYDFGKGWTMGMEIEFEHGGTGASVEIDAEESGEYEHEAEKGGEVNLEQFWVNKAFWKGQFNIKAGEIIVPVGYSNQHHLPTEFFTCYRPEGEATLLPNTWHQVGISLWGRVKDWRYEAQFLSGLDSERFRQVNYVHYGATSTYEFKVANCYAFAGRIDNYSIPGLRLGLSAYLGRTFRNTLVQPGSSYDDVKGNLSIIAFDFTYNKYNWLVRGNVDFSNLSDASAIASYNAAHASHHKYQDGNPYHREDIGNHAFAWGMEAGYDVFGQFAKKLHEAGQKLYVFGRYEYYNSMSDSQYDNLYRYVRKHRMALGINYFPIKQVVIKAEYSKRFYKTPDNGSLLPDSPLYVQPLNNEPSLNVSVAFSGWFL